MFAYSGSMLLVKTKTATPPKKPIFCLGIVGLPITEVLGIKDDWNLESILFLFIITLFPESRKKTVDYNSEILRRAIPRETAKVGPVSRRISSRKAGV